MSDETKREQQRRENMARCLNENNEYTTPEKGGAGRDVQKDQKENQYNIKQRRGTLQ